MIEKRFTLTDNVGMLDVACGNIYDNGKFIGTVQLCDGDKFVELLNAQHEENQSLKDQLKNLRRLVNEAYMEGSE